MTKFSDINPKFKFWATSQGPIKNVIGDGRLRLLKAIHQQGSLKEAALVLNISYRKAWNDLKKMEEALEVKLVETKRGGPSGGITTLTDFGIKLLKAYHQFRHESIKALNGAYQKNISKLFLTEGDEICHLPNLLLIGAANKNSGKTTLATSIIKKFSSGHKIMAIKIELLKSDDPNYKSYRILEETKASSNTDTGKLLQVGADKVYLLKAKKENIKECFQSLLKKIGTKALMICESNSLRSFVIPGLFFIIKNSNNDLFKQSAINVKKFADQIIHNLSLIHI